ncbi:hypothetical protein PUNSTDRAFT_50197 [Punctularia strigosozonata HHB-11173 SS5]|uniref:uncharacterized protein n=1 Tax=Punctularia strigosozonata (strain HHB-11173) TaxID=741275 RepID=UPI0004417A88|nr:uncharacterized protein PUNSTDRAFT_50197 [Punctularia strigosozonata HHB-11173 SS5]EIN13028.1 hypothetical protein PUNSTDRAFT_50197 [Punctularia strigosozonata HHB-11173 SS5]
MARNINVISMFPDDDTDKEVFLQAAGKSYSGKERHVSLYWINRDQGMLFVEHVLQLIGAPGNYHWENMARFRDRDAGWKDTIYPLGRYTREQRDQIVKLAGLVEYNPSSTVNSCRAWMRDLLEAMTEDPIVSLDRNIFEQVDEQVPLAKRRPEVV